MSEWACDRIAELEERVAEYEERMRRLEEREARLKENESVYEQLLTLAHTCEVWGGLRSPTCYACLHGIRKPTPV